MKTIHKKKKEKNMKQRQVFYLLCVFSLFFILSSNVSADVDLPPEVKTTAVWLNKIRQSGENYWAILRETLNRGQSHFFPPNTDFTGKDGGEPMGPGENIKEAATRSFEKTKETVEEAARSAAEVVSDTTEVVKEKLKRSVSGRATQHPESTEEL